MEITDTSDQTTLNPSAFARIPKLGERLRLVYRSRLPHGPRILLAYLCFRVDKESGETYVKIATMARETGAGASTIRDHLSYLKACGWIERKRRLNKSSLTRLRPEAFATAEANGTANRQPNGEPMASARDSRPSASRMPIADVGDTDSQPLSGSISDSIPGNQSSGAEVHNTGEHIRSDRDQPKDDFFQLLFEKLKLESYRHLTKAQFHWAVKQIKARARTPPKSRAYWEKSLAEFFQNIDRETEVGLEKEAEHMLRAGNTLGAVADRLKWLVTENELPCTLEQIEKALNGAEAKLRRLAAVCSELKVGTGPA